MRCDYKTEFRYFDFDIPTIPDGFTDCSWHNNVCPSFERVLGDRLITFWVDYKNPKRRERTWGKQFFVTSEPNNDDLNDHELVFETESWDEAINSINQLFNEAKQ